MQVRTAVGVWKWFAHAVVVISSIVACGSRATGADGDDETGSPDVETSGTPELDLPADGECEANLPLLLEADSPVLRSSEDHLVWVTPGVEIWTAHVPELEPKLVYAAEATLAETDVYPGDSTLFFAIGNEVYRAPYDTAVPELIHEGVGPIVGLAANETSVFVGNDLDDDGHVDLVEVSLAGDPPTVVHAGGGSPFQLVGDTVYYADDGAIWARAPSMDPRRLVQGGGWSIGAAVHEDWLYMFDPLAIQRVPTDGEDSPPIEFATPNEEFEVGPLPAWAFVDGVLWTTSARPKPVPDRCEGAVLEGYPLDGGNGATYGVLGPRANGRASTSQGPFFADHHGIYRLYPNP